VVDILLPTVDFPARTVAFHRHAEEFLGGGGVFLRRTGEFHAAGVEFLRLAVEFHRGTVEFLRASVEWHFCAQFRGFTGFRPCSGVVNGGE
jgi:hypothetical protein